MMICREPITGVRPWKRVLVAFEGPTELWYIRFLRKGFRHCFVLLYDGNSWFMINSAYDRLHVKSGCFPGEEYPERILADYGFTVVGTYIRAPYRHKAHFGIFSCVELVKRVLGINRLFIQTPYALYKFLVSRPQAVKP